MKGATSWAAPNAVPREIFVLDVGGGPDSDDVDVFYETENMENHEYNRTA
jgi:hypothetical protein